MIDKTTLDDFLGGRLKIYQPLKGYRAGIDPVLLAASVPAKSGQSTLELGCGVGVASLALGTRVSGLSQTGIEIQEAYGQLALKNAQTNGINIELIQADLADLPLDIRNKQYDHVLANPPYYDRNKSTRAHNEGREKSFGLDTALDIWTKVAAKRLVSGGWAHFIYRADRFDVLFRALPKTLGSFILRPIVPRIGRDASLIILHCRKAGRAAMRIESPLILHEGAVHEQDGESYTAAVKSILRDGASMTIS